MGCTNTAQTKFKSTLLFFVALECFHAPFPTEAWAAAGHDVDKCFETAVQVTDEWTYARTPRGQDACTDVRSRLTPKYVEQRRVPLVLRTAKQVLQPQPEAAAVLHELLAWISRVDEAARRGDPRPPTRQLNGQPLFPNSKWWLTEMERRRPADVAGTVDADAQLDEADVTLDPGAAGAASSGTSSASAEEDSDASLPAGPPLRKTHRTGTTSAGVPAPLGTVGSCPLVGASATSPAPAFAMPQRNAPDMRPSVRLRGKTSPGSLRPVTPEQPQPSLLHRTFLGSAASTQSHLRQNPSARARLVMGSSAVPDLPADLRLSAKRGDADIDIVHDPSAASSDRA